MKKVLGIITASSIYLSSASLSLAQINISLDDASGIASKSKELIPFIINLLFALGIILAVVFLLWGGIRWIMSRGDKTKVEEARSHIISAIIGLIFVIGAFVILNITTLILTGKTLSQTFTLPSLTTTITPSPILGPSPTP